MLARIQSSIKSRALIRLGDHVLLAVSGGADSVAMLAAMRELARGLKLHLTVAHLNHGIRGKQAAADAAFVCDMAASLKIPCVTGRSDVPRLARRRGISLEMAARDARYAFLVRTARKVRAGVIATAHTADDQAETVLLKLARGAGPSGLGGMTWVAHRQGLRLVRPMLEVTREEVVRFLVDRGLSWREDATNRDLSHLRNRVRHELLPLLESRLNPSARKTLTRVAEIMRDEDAWIDTIARRKLSACMATEAELDVGTLKCEPIALRRRVLRLWLVSQGVPPERVDFDGVARIERLIAHVAGSKKVAVGGAWVVKRRYSRLCAERTGAVRDMPGFRAAVNLPGETLLPDAGLRIVAAIEPGLVKPRQAKPACLPARASVSRSAVGRRRIYARSWQPGDRLLPLGMVGSKKIQDIFVDSKVPADMRHTVPIFECAGEIIWLPGFRIARGWEVQDAKAPAVQLYVERD